LRIVFLQTRIEKIILIRGGWREREKKNGGE
jgi:hypothetical protein